MKISIGMALQPGPWGGVNQFGRSLVDYLHDRGVQVCFDLDAPDLDLIILVEPRPELRISTYSHFDVERYISAVNPKALVIHRVNECDERKGTSGVNQIVLEANRCADHTVFVSRWLQDLFVQQELPCRSSSVILNGSDTKVFDAGKRAVWNRMEPLRLVTHHWSSHRMKGFDTYEEFDRLLERDDFRENYSFTYIGNLPDGFVFRNVCYLSPLHGQDLAAALCEHHAYLTASRNEPGSNHQNEAACCGLPLLYRQSGAMPEYCSGFGVPFDGADFEIKLTQLKDEYWELAELMGSYPCTAERMCTQYYELFVQLLDNAAELRQHRTC